MKVRRWNKLESFVGREEHLWPDCERPSNSFLPPHAVRPSHPNLFGSSVLGRSVRGLSEGFWVREPPCQGRQGVGRELLLRRGGGGGGRPTGVQEGPRIGPRFYGGSGSEGSKMQFPA